MRSKIKAAAATTGDAIIGAQGVAGVACLTGGALVIAGVGAALVVLGAFLLLGAWATR